MVFKRLFLVAGLAISLASTCFADIQQKLAKLETSADGRIGVSAIDTGNNKLIQYRAEERFPFCSTFKMMGAAAVLKSSMTDKNFLQQRITYKKADIVPYSPETEKHIADGMTVSELCAAAVTKSDDTAINLLIKKLGGLKSINNFARSIGDKEFRLDRWEVELNTAIPGDLRDTTTPRAMQKSLQKVAVENALGYSQRELLQTWLKNNTTGDHRIRAGVPKGWIVGDKTGIGDYGTTNDIGVMWPTGCKPIVLVVYFTQNKKDAKLRDDVLATATKLVVDEFARSDKCIKSSILHVVA